MKKKHLMYYYYHRKTSHLPSFQWRKYTYTFISKTHLTDFIRRKQNRYIFSIVYYLIDLYMCILILVCKHLLSLILLYSYLKFSLCQSLFTNLVLCNYYISLSARLKEANCAHEYTLHTCALPLSHVLSLILSPLHTHTSTYIFLHKY